MIDIVLEKPFEFGGDTIDKVSLRELTTGDLRKTAEITNAELRMMALIERLGGLPPSQVDCLHPQDYERLVEALTPFLPSSLVIGLMPLGESLIRSILEQRNSTASA